VVKYLWRLCWWQNEHQQSLRELGKIAIINHLTTFIAWS